MTYSYTNRNLLAGEPYHYHFADFEGPDFLADYRASRLAWLERYGNQDLPTCHAAALPEFDRVDMETAAVLEALLTAFRKPADAGLDLAGAWLDLMIRRFEASKRLRRRYSSGLKVVDRASVDVESYAVLAICIALSAPDDISLKKLNTLLKLNDLVLSVPNASSRAVICAAHAVQREISAIDGLARAKGLAISMEPQNVG